jgi:hypothetical protein
MSNYVQSTNFETKDALVSGNPLKIVKGIEINTEFVDIAVAVATKADLTQLSASYGSSLVGFLQSGTGAASRTVQAKMRESVSVLDFGAVGNGVTDDTAAIQAAINAAAGKSLFLPPGAYKYSALTLTANNTTLYGEGRATRLVCSLSTGNTLDIGDGTNEARNIVLRDLTFWSSVTRSAGATIRARKLVRSQLQNVFIGTPEDFNANGNRLFDGITIAEYDNVTIDGGYVLTSNSGIIVYGNSGQTFGAECFIGGGIRVLRQAQHGIHIGGGAGGVKLDNLDVSNCQYGLYVSDDLGGAYNREIFIGSTASFDNCTTGNGRGMWFDTNSCVYTEISGAWVASNVVGIDIQPAQPAGAAWKIDGSRVYNHSSDGVVINDGFVTIDGAAIHTNGGHGINNGTAITDGLIVSSTQLRNNTGYGLVIVAGSDNFLIEGNYFSTNALGPLSNGASVSASKVIKENLGLVTEANGTSTVLSGDSTVVVNHGLHDAPTHVLVGRTNPSDGTPHYVTTLTATQFTINNGAVAGVNRDFTWRAIRGFR